jgi:hypothetical protein
MNQIKLNVFQTIIDIGAAIKNAELALKELEQLRAEAFDEPVKLKPARDQILKRNRFYILTTDDN